MDKTESISAKLRRWAEDSKTYDSPAHCIASKSFGFCCPNIPCFKCERDLFRHIADEIDRERQSTLRNCAYPLTQEVGKPLEGDEDFESWLDRWYFEKPVDENNEPIDFGKTVNDKVRGEMEVSRICYTDSGFYFNNSRSTNRKRRKMRGITYHYGDRVKRSKPQVLDADGVPIEIGDKVWLLPGEHCKAFPFYGFKAGVEYTVSENESAIHKENGRICITKGNCIYGYPMPEQVTHREPDTQERIDEDALKEPCVYFNHETGGCQSCPAFEKYDCNVHKSLDLLRRQRELDGRDA